MISTCPPSDNQALAYAFAEYVTVGDGVQLRLDQGEFPRTPRPTWSPRSS
jgi:hypothetical protein